MKMLILVFALVILSGRAFAQDGHLPGLDKPTDCIIRGSSPSTEDWKAVPRGKAVRQLNTRTAHMASNISWEITQIRTNRVTVIIGSKKRTRTTSSLLVSATLLNYASFRSRCIAPKAMGGDVNIQPSTYAIIGGGIWGTANTCAGAPEILA